MSIAQKKPVAQLRPRLVARPVENPVRFYLTHRGDVCFQDQNSWAKRCYVKHPISGHTYNRVRVSIIYDDFHITKRSHEKTQDLYFSILGDQTYLGIGWSHLLDNTTRVRYIIDSIENVVF